MKTKEKNMKLFKVLYLLLAFCIVMPTGYASKTMDDYSRASTIIVEGSSSLSATPDQANIDIGVVTSAESAHAAEQENARIAAKIQKTLLALGIAQDKINTTRYTFYPVYSNEKNKSNEIIAYNVNNTVSVTINDLNKIGDTIDASINAGANSINSINFILKDNTAIKKQALQFAIKDAKEKAEIIAKSLDKRIVNVLAVSEGGTSIENRNFARYSLKAASYDNAVTPITPGNINVSASIEIVFEIQ